MGHRKQKAIGQRLFFAVRLIFLRLFRNFVHIFFIIRVLEESRVPMPLSH